MADSGLTVDVGQAPSRVNPGRRIWRNTFLVTLASVLLLAPCFWQSRIQAGDLSSHLYNAWLATLIDQGKAPGLWIEHRSNNILSDVALQWLLQHGGTGVAQRIVVSAAVLIFGWGAIAFISAVGGRKNWWLILPWVWMLSYGFFYQMGFFNFYLSFGLCLWYLTIFWRFGWRMGLACSPLLILAWTAQPFPVVWAVGIAAYLAVARNQQPRQRLITLGLGVVVLWGCAVHPDEPLPVSLVLGTGIAGKRSRPVTDFRVEISVYRCASFADCDPAFDSIDQNRRLEEPSLQYAVPALGT